MKMQLKTWEELVGRLVNVQNNNDGTTTLTVAAHDRIIEVNIPSGISDFRKLLNCKIGVLKTNDPNRPFLLRIVNAKGGCGHGKKPHGAH